MSAHAAYLAKKSKQQELTSFERRKMENYADTFMQCSLSGYYEENLGCTAIPDANSEADNLYRNCGFAYIERIIYQIKNGGTEYGAGMC